MIRYAILIPGEEMVGYIECSSEPTLEMCADALAEVAGFPDREEMVAANPHMNILGFAPIH